MLLRLVYLHGLTQREMVQDARLERIKGKPAALGRHGAD